MESRIIPASELSKGQPELYEKATRYALIRGYVGTSNPNGPTLEFEVGTLVDTVVGPSFLRVKLITHKLTDPWWVKEIETSGSSELDFHRMLTDWNQRSTSYRQPKTVIVYTGSGDYPGPHYTSEVGYLHPQLLQIILGMRYAIQGYGEKSDDSSTAEACIQLVRRLDGVIRDQWSRLTISGVKPLFT